MHTYRYTCFGCVLSTQTYSMILRIRVFHEFQKYVNKAYRQICVLNLFSILHSHLLIFNFSHPHVHLHALSFHDFYHFGVRLRWFQWIRNAPHLRLLPHKIFKWSARRKCVCFSLCLCTATCNCVDERAMMCFILLHLRNFAAAVEEWEKNRRKLLFFAKMCDANEFLVSAKSNAWVSCY